ncbi:hypothetical protein O6H91_07G006000 [Diphasiastrum complanatum]|nr:hypothetical protein O6H91_07G006000 [Diphasiastrum complanatum]
MGEGGGEGLSHALIESQFAHHQKGIARLNNGSFGSSPARVLVAQAEWQQLWLQQPDEFYFGPLERGLVASRMAVASLINACDVGEVCLLDNATTAAAMVAQDVAWAFTESRYSKGDLILLLSITYAAVKKAFQAYAVRAGAKILEVEILLPVHSDAEVMASFQEAFQKARNRGKTIRLAVLDHVTSMPSVVLPIVELVKLCREEGVETVFVDGAHAIGNVEINVQEIDADYYTSNLHKWFFAPTAACFLHCKAEHLDRLHHPVISHNYGKGLIQECAWVGTKDYSPLLAVTAAFDFIVEFVGGVEVLRNHNHKAVVEMGEMLASAWGTECGTTSDLCSAMMMVALPSKLNIQSHEDGLRLRDKLRTHFFVEVPIYFQEKENPLAQRRSTASGTSVLRSRAYVRISFQIYNKPDDYYKLRDAVKLLANKEGGATL